MGWLQDFNNSRKSITSPVTSAVEKGVSTMRGVVDKGITALPLDKQQATDAAVLAAIAAGGYYAYPYLTGAAGAEGAAGAASTAATPSIAGAAGTAATTAGTAGAGTGGTLSSLLGAYGAADQFIADLPGTKQQGQATLAGLTDMYGQYQQGQAAKDTASQSQQLNMPWYNAGLSSLAKMQAGPSAYEESPYNKYLQESGAKQIQRSAAAKGMLGSGNVLAALSDYGQSTARQGYNDWWNQQGTLAGYGTNARSNLENANAFGNMGQAASNLGMLNAGGKMLANYW